MPASPQQLLRQLEHLVPSPAALGESDAILLHRFACGRDEAAFTALVLRHGPMVLGVCRRVLRDVRDAEDVLQATFLILARKAASLSRPEALAAWLHGTAYRLALRCRRADQRRRQHETQAVPPVPVRPPQDPLDDLTARELLAILDEEVQRLPEVYRLPVLLCCLNGHTQEEAARLLGCTPGAVKGRLERGRQSLQQRLARRGLAAPVVFAALELARGLASAAVPAAMAHTITRAASVSLTGGDIIGTGISASAAALAKQALRGGGATLKLGAALLLTLGLLAGAGALTPQQPEAKVPAAQPPDPPRVQGQQGPAADLRNDPLPPGARARLGTVRFRQGGGYVGILLYSPDGKTLASAGYEENIYLWDAVTGQCIRRLAGHKNKCGMIAWSPDGKLLASTGQEYDATIRLWDVATGQLARTINTPKDTHIIAYSPDGKLLASLGRDWLPILWDAATGKEVRRLPKTTHQPCHLSFSCDGKIVAVGSHDGLLRLWETASGKELQRFSCSSGGVVGAAFSADGQLFATGTNGGIVSLWDPTSGKLLRRWPKHEGYASSLAFSADGKILLASWFHSSLLVRRPTSIKLLDTTTGKEV
ncbi:MAG TPA: sigma-70 family RNA polymerase sigma factor, partial [Gemmataceae bacterium]|nr:sigma-70 family RNA polymerase sigma factor [Gemmataceae bacterium]